MIEFRDVSVRYGPKALFEHASFKINAGERVGIVGPNGSGKSTLFRLILGDLTPDVGDVLHEGAPRIGFVRQHLEPDSPEQTLLQYCLEGIPGFERTERDIARLEEALAVEKDPTAKARMLRELGEAHTRFEQMGGWSLEARVKESLGGLGYATEDFGRPFATFSGGWRMRAELSRVLASKPELLLLDEPSNYLDLPAVEWLQRFLRGFEGTLVLISHDRYLLRAITRITVEVDGGTVTRYNGPLDYYLTERETRYRQLLQAKANQDRKREQLERFVERFRAQATKASQAQSRERQLEKMEEIRLPARSRSAGYLRLPKAPHAGAEIVRLEGAAYAYPGSDHPVFSGLDLRVMNGDKIAIVGYNGMGKTTLLRVLAGVRAPTEGKAVFGYHVAPGYQSQDFAETMNPDETVFAVAKAAAGALKSALKLGASGLSDALDIAPEEAGNIEVGAAILDYFINRFPCRRIIVPGVTTRSAVAEDCIRQRSGRPDRSFDADLVAVCHAIGRKYAFDADHAGEVAHLAGMLLAKLKREFDFEVGAGLLLEAAAVLHDIGRFVDTRQHHKHSGYLIANMQLPGVSAASQRVIAAAARYHRGSGPKASHSEYTALPDRDKVTVLKLAAILRVADALDCARSRRFHRMKLVRRGNQLIIRSGAADLRSEQFYLARKSGLFIQVFGLELKIEEDVL